MCGSAVEFRGAVCIIIIMVSIKPYELLVFLLELVAHHQSDEVGSCSSCARRVRDATDAIVWLVCVRACVRACAYLVPWRLATVSMPVHIQACVCV